MLFETLALRAAEIVLTFLCGISIFWTGLPVLGSPCNCKICVGRGFRILRRIAVLTSMDNVRRKLSLVLTALSHVERLP